MVVVYCLDVIVEVNLVMWVLVDVGVDVVLWMVE